MRRIHPSSRIRMVGRCRRGSPFRNPYVGAGPVTILLAVLTLGATGFGGARIAAAQELVPPDAIAKDQGDADDDGPSQRPSIQTPTRSRPDDFDGRVRAIHERIELIKSLMEREKKSRQAEQVPVEPAASEDAPVPVVTQAATPDRVQAMPRFENTPPRTSDRDEDQAPMPSTIPLDAQPVEAFELAGSLYMTGNYAKAREIYERLLKKKLPRDQAAWARVLMANCLWHLGETDQAEIVYRDLTREKEGLYPVEFARLSLTELDRHRRFASRWAAIENGLSQYLNQPSEESHDE